MVDIAPNGSPQQVQQFYGISTLSTNTSPTYLMSLHELNFLKAEAYNDYRRLVAMGNNVLQLASTRQFPQRLTYGDSDVSTNQNVATAYGDGNYVYTEKVWWAGGTR